ncbi:hypothetical protein F2P81_004693 [Scophthalmus maximus]|uniref:Uncharacterized protein n=1 Tax=Scophthalmus maximus TaxID=52904 RepID=A0A6A4T704_SCOMX|nr:hypothetical protein F2P81_004693 [Scophthalmus maximus]
MDSYFKSGSVYFGSIAAATETGADVTLVAGRLAGALIVTVMEMQLDGTSSVALRREGCVRVASMCSETVFAGVCVCVSPLLNANQCPLLQLCNHPVILPVPPAVSIPFCMVTANHAWCPGNYYDATFRSNIKCLHLADMKQQSNPIRLQTLFAVQREAGKLLNQLRYSLSSSRIEMPPPLTAPPVTLSMTTDLRAAEQMHVCDAFKMKPNKGERQRECKENEEERAVVE